MRTYQIHLNDSITCYCIRASHFPSDAKACHEKLHAQVKFSSDRQYYGLSRYNDKGSLDYLAACTELFEGELASLGLEKIVLEPKNYLCSDLEDYMNHIEKLGSIFAVLCEDRRFDKQAWAIEWYKERVCNCMVPLI